MIESNYDVTFIAGQAKREKQIQQNYRPIIAVHKWFARRPGTLFRGLLLSEFVDAPLKESFYRSNDLRGLTMADPFMGGGTPLVEANRLGCNTVGYDINPMSYWIVKQEIEHINLDRYCIAARKLRDDLGRQIGQYYTTKCTVCGSFDASVKYFLWVKVIDCIKCGKPIDLFPGYLIAENVRHPKNVLVCPNCGDLNEIEDLHTPGNCNGCSTMLQVNGPAQRNKCECPHCGETNAYLRPEQGPPTHRMFAIEYSCGRCGGEHKGRFFKKPDADDLAKYDDAMSKWQNTDPRFVPNDDILLGDETDRLHHWGYTKYIDMFNPRQLLGLELSCRLVNQQSNTRLRNALATNLSDLLRYQNMLCRYDTMALKSLDIFSVHGFPVGLIQCESNIIGVCRENGGANIGSGGWSNIIDKFIKAKSYCDHPFEYDYIDGKKVKVETSGEWIGDAKYNNLFPDSRLVHIYCGDAAEATIEPESFDAVFTDPPYGGNVQYAELMDFCYVWLRRLAHHVPEFNHGSTRSINELTINQNMGRDLDYYTEGLSLVYKKMGEALKPGAPLAFTFHHNKIEAYYSIAIAILDSELACTVALPCPAEMGASIHINGTGSSTVDTIFVCRKINRSSHSTIIPIPTQVIESVEKDAMSLVRAGVKLTKGDIRCIAYGHLTRLAVLSLGKDWDKNQSVKQKLHLIADWLDQSGGLASVNLCYASKFINP